MCTSHLYLSTNCFDPGMKPLSAFQSPDGWRGAGGCFGCSVSVRPFRGMAVCSNHRLSLMAFSLAEGMSTFAYHFSSASLGKQKEDDILLTKALAASN